MNQDLLCLVLQRRRRSGGTSYSVNLARSVWGGLHCHEKETQETQKWRVPLDVGKRCGLTDGDIHMCKTEDAEGEKTFYCSPTQQMAQSRDEINAAIHQSSVRAAALDSSRGESEKSCQKGVQERARKIY
jgi:hypothetical protein